MEFTCETCGASLSTNTSLQRHVRAQHQDLKHLCQFCDKAFRYVTAKTRHEKHCTVNKKKPTNQIYTCGQCDKKFKKKLYLDAHTQAQHLGITYTCEKCKKSLKNSLDRKKHSQTCGTETNKIFSCSHCQKEFSTACGLISHRKSHEMQQKKPANLKRKSETSRIDNATRQKKRRTAIVCRKCYKTFPNRHAHYLHKMKEHIQTGHGTALQQPPLGSQAPALKDIQPLVEVYDANRPLILANHQEGSVQSIFNFPISNDFTVDNIMQHANQVYEKQNSAFRLNLEFGLILVNTDSGEYRYFTPYSNEALFNRPIYVSRRQDLRRLRLRLQGLNITDFILRQRPDTKWKPVLVTNVRFTLYHLNYALGTVTIQLPDYVKNSKSIISLDKNSKGKFYKDHLCAFRCLATYQGHHKHRLEMHTETLFAKWVQYMQHKCPENKISLDQKTFKGVELSQFVYFEK